MGLACVSKINFVEFKSTFQKYPDIFTKKSAISICIILWIFSLLVQIPSFLGWGDYKYVSYNILNSFCSFVYVHIFERGFQNFFLIFRYDRKNFGCLWDRTHPSPYLFIIFAALVALPTLTILICYYKIFAYAKMCKELV